MSFMTFQFHLFLFEMSLIYGSQINDDLADFSDTDKSPAPYPVGCALFVLWYEWNGGAVRSSQELSTERDNSSLLHGNIPTLRTHCVRCKKKNPLPLLCLVCCSSK